jgi:osmotically-inducible protein OsmY
VVANGKLVGIVSRANLLHGLANMIVDHHEPGAEKDRHLRNELLNALLDRPELESVLINVIVRDGKVRLWGVVESDGEVAAAAKVAEGVPGVVSVENNLNLGPLSGVPV